MGLIAQHPVGQHRVYLIEFEFNIKRYLVAVGYRHGFVRRFLDDIDGHRFDQDERYRV